MEKVNKTDLFVLFKSLAFTIILSLCIIGLVSCSDNDSNDASFYAKPFTPIEEYENEGLVYMNFSKTIYILYSDYGGYGYLAPYIQNGHFCEYIDGEIVEIIPIKENPESSINETETKISPDDIWNNLTNEEKDELIQKLK